MFPERLTKELASFVDSNNHLLPSAKAYFDTSVVCEEGYDGSLGSARHRLEVLAGLVLDDISKWTESWTGELIDSATVSRLSAAITPAISPVASEMDDDWPPITVANEPPSASNGGSEPSSVGSLGSHTVGIASSMAALKCRPPVHPSTPTTPGSAHKKTLEWYEGYKNLSCGVAVYVCVGNSLEPTYRNLIAEQRSEQLRSRGANGEGFDSHFGDTKAAMHLRKQVIETLSDGGDDKVKTNVEPVSSVPWTCDVTKKKFITLVFNIREPRTRERAVAVFQNDITDLREAMPAKMISSSGSLRSQVDKDSDAGLTPIDKSMKLLTRVRDNGYLDSVSIQAINSVIRMLQTEPERLYDVDVSEIVTSTGSKKDRDVVMFIEGFTRQHGANVTRRPSGMNPHSRRRHSVATSNFTRSSQSLFPMSKMNVFPAMPVNHRKSSEDTRLAADNTVTTWEFNVFAFAKSTNDPLVVLMDHMMDRYKLFSTFKISQGKFRRFAKAIQDGYIDTHPYHNKVHATDVLQTCFHFLEAPGVKQKMNISDIECLAVIIAAAGHDFRHPGVSNNFLIATNNKLAIEYNDQSVLENMHCSKMFEELYKEENNFLSESNLSKDDQLYLRKLIVSMVLSTDMTQHFALLGEFRHRLGSELDTREAKDRSLVLRTMIKCADISNVGKPLDIYMEWADRVMNEFFLQGDRERELGIPISAFMDRHKDETARCQVSFISFIVRPLFQEWETFTDMEYLKQIDSNLAYWKQKQELQESENLSETISEEASDSLPSSTPSEGDSTAADNK